MLASRCACNTGPDLREPSFMVFIRNDAQKPRRITRTSIPTRLSLHEYEFDIILDNGIGLIRLAQKSRAPILDLVNDIGDLVPDDRSKIVVSNFAAVFLNGSV